MPRISFDGFKDPARRPRFVLWTGTAVLGLVVFVVVAFGVTSTKWFCAEVCHNVQADTITSHARSSHSNVSCMACHSPVNADPITFAFGKAKKLGELYLTATGNYHIPLNATSHYALTVPEKQCTQCHSANRLPTPSIGIIIDHDIHSENDVTCTMCHNRVAHIEDFELTLTDPKTGEPSYKHDDWMLMTACFRCHSHDDDPKAPGACEACHPADFELKPANHFEEGFYPAGHAEMALAEVERAAAAAAAAEEHASAARSARWAAGGSAYLLGIQQAHAAGGASDNPWAESIPSVAEINYCSTCHAEKFCSDCHGLPMPHPADFQEGHGDLGRNEPAVCATCHAKGDATGTQFCNACHHPDGDPTLPWIPQHFNAVKETGAQACFDCHAPTFCAECHVSTSLGR